MFLLIIKMINNIDKSSGKTKQEKTGERHKLSLLGLKGCVT